MRKTEPQLFEVWADKICFDGYEVARIEEKKLPRTTLSEFVESLRKSSIVDHDKYDEGHEDGYQQGIGEGRGEAEAAIGRYDPSSLIDDFIEEQGLKTTDQNKKRIARFLKDYSMKLVDRLQWEID